MAWKIKECISIVLMLYLAFCGAGKLQAQEFAANVRIIGVEQGLRDRHIISMCQDSSGYIWMISNFKLYRFDGYYMHEMTHILGPKGLHKNFRIIQARYTGNYLLLNTSAGILRVDPYRLSSMALYNNGTGLLDRILNVYWLPDRIVGFKPDGEALTIDYQGKQLSRVRLEGIQTASSYPVLIMNRELTRYGLVMTDKKFHVFDLKGRKVNLQDINALPVPEGIVRLEPAFTKVNDENTLMLNYYSGYVSANTFSGDSLQRIAIYNEHKMPDTRIAEIAGNAFLTYGNNFYIQDSTGRIVYDISALINKSLLNNRHQVQNYVLSNNNVLWVNVGYCIVQVSIIPQVFHRHLSKDLASDNLVGTSLRGMYESAPGEIWAVSYGLDGNFNYSLHHIVDGREESLMPVPGYPPSAFYRIRGYVGDTVLLMNEYGVLYKKSLYSDYAELLFAPQSYSLQSYDVFSTANKDFLIATAEGVLLVRSGQTSLEKGAIPFLKGTEGMKFNGIIPAPDGNIYAYGSEGIFLLDRFNYKLLKKYSSSNDAEILIPPVVVKHMLQDSSIIYAATESGLLKIDLSEKSFRLYNELDGFQNSFLYSVLKGKKNDLWLSSNKGIFRWNTGTGNLQSFGMEHGLPSMEFNNASYLSSAQNKLYFGGLNGMATIDLNSINDLGSDSMKFSLEFCTYFNIAKKKVDTLYNFQLQDLNFKAGTSNIAFTFFCSEMQSIEQNRFRYRLAGSSDTSWMLMDKGNTLLFNYLPAGDYILEAEVSAAGLNWNNKAVRIPFSMSNYWYKTWWFYMLSLLVMGSTIYFIVNQRLAELKKILRIRNHISADIHDEIGSTLSSITLYSHTLLISDPRKEQLPILEKIKRNAQEVQEALSDIIWSIKPSMDTVENIVTRMKTYGKEYTEDSDMTFTLTYDPVLVNVTIGMECRKNFYLIFKEAVNNAIKYSQATHINANISLESKSIVVMNISDNGIGFDTSNAGFGNGLSNMEQRAKEMQGSVYVDSRPGAGTNVTLSFPVHKSK